MNPTQAPEALDWSVDTCTIARAMAILGERWTVVVLREIFNGVRRFDDMRIRTNIPRQVLANRLASLVGHGVLRREPYREPGSRVRHEYRLTDKGRDLHAALVALMQWGDRWLADDGVPPLQLTHRDCGEPVSLTLRCAAGHHLAGPREVAAVPNAVASARPAETADTPAG